MSARTDPARPSGPGGDRRRFLSLLSAALGAVAAALVGFPLVGFLLAPFFSKPPEKWRRVGTLDQFQIGTTVEVTLRDASPLPWAGVTANTGAWLRRNGEREFIAFSMNCTHLGCPVRWVAHADLFMCPCHGGVYYKDGTVAGGPPPRPLFRYPVRVRGTDVEVRTSAIPIV
jgi:quinol---cytochrome c reductase iron-sulfur subunit, bacillus type